MTSADRFPPNEWLRDLLLEGRKYAEITDLWEEKSGHRLSPRYVAMRVARHFQDLPPRRPRYQYDLPWRVKGKHDDHPFARLLRLLARRRDGQKLGYEADRWLTNWVKEMRDADCVVDYVPNAADPAEAFIPVARKPGDREMTSIRHVAEEHLTDDEKKALE